MIFLFFKSFVLTLFSKITNNIYIGLNFEIDNLLYFGENQKRQIYIVKEINIDRLLFVRGNQNRHIYILWRLSKSIDLVC